MKGNLLLAGTDYGGIFISRNGEKTWAMANDGLGNLRMRAITSHGSTLYAGSGSGVYVSRDHDRHWMAAGLQGRIVQSILVDGSRLFAGTFGAGVWTAHTHHLLWPPVNDGLESDLVVAMAREGKRMYAATIGGVFVSTNDGKSWFDVSDDLTHLSVIVIDVEGHNVVIGTQGGGIFVSRNGGVNCTNITPFTGTDVRLKSEANFWTMALRASFDLSLRIP
jgi:photosystem II stability/assembly factor-like uncharacterized protein